MSRPHTYVKIRELQFLLTRLMGEASHLQASDPNYQLDVEFSKELDQLIDRYGYSDDEALRLIEIVSRYESQEGFELRRLIADKPEDSQIANSCNEVNFEPTS